MKSDLLLHNATGQWRNKKKKSIVDLASNFHLTPAIKSYSAFRIVMMQVIRIENLATRNTSIRVMVCNGGRVYLRAALGSNAVSRNRQALRIVSLLDISHAEHELRVASPRCL